MLCSQWCVTLLFGLMTTDEAWLTCQRRSKSSSGGAAIVPERLSAWNRKAFVEGVDQIDPLNTRGT